MNLFDLFATLNLDSSGYESGLSDAEKSANSFGSKLKSGLGGAAKVATAAVTAVATTATALSGAMVSGAKDLAGIGDNIDKASQKMGISATAYQEWDHILQHSGSSIDAMSRGLLGLQTKVASGSEAFEKLGLSQEQVAAMSTEDLFATVIASLQDMEEGAERTALSQELLGNAYKELGPLLNTTAEDTEAMRQQAHELGAVLSDDVVKSSAGFQDSLQDMQAAMGGLKNQIMSDMLPGLTDLMQGFTGLLTGAEGADETLAGGMNKVVAGIAEGANKLMTFGAKIAPALMNAISENLPMLAESGVQMIEQLAMSIIENMPMFIEAGIKILTTLAASLGNNMPTIVDAIVNAISDIALMLTNPDVLSGLLGAVVKIILAIANGISNNLPTLVSTIMQVVKNLSKVVLDNLPVFIKAAVEIILALANGLMEALPTLLGYLPELIDGIVAGLLELLPILVEAGITLFVALVEALPTIIESIVAVLPEIINSICNALLTMIPEIIQAGITLLTALITNMPEIISTIVTALPQIISGITKELAASIPQIITAGFDLIGSLFNDLPKAIIDLVAKLPELISEIVSGLVGGIGDIVNVGIQIVEGLWKGIESMGSWLWEQVSGFFGGVVDGVLGFLGIASPSKVFADMGKMIDLGFAEGIEDYANLAVKAVEDMSDDVIGAANTDLNFTANADVDELNGTAGSGRGVVINVYGEKGQDVNELAEIISQKIAFEYSQDQAAWA